MNPEEWEAYKNRCAFYTNLYPSPKQPTQDDMLVMYFIVNDSLGMGIGKVAAQVGHAVQLILSADSFNATTDTRLNLWKDHKLNGGFRKVVLKADAKEFKKIQEMYQAITVVDAGLTEVEPNSETVIVLFPMFKDERSKELKRLRCL